MAVNYYDELNLDREGTLEDINAQLTQLEATWKRREVNSPEKATKMLALIIDARKAFASDEARRAYDDSLVSGAQGNDAFVAQCRQARAFCDSGDYDLAKTSVDKALAALGGAPAGADAYMLAATVYMRNGLYGEALGFVNSAIADAPRNAALFRTRGLIFAEQAKAADGGDAAGLWDKANRSLETAMSLAHEVGNTRLEGSAAASLAVNALNAGALDKAREYAGKAVELGDPDGTGKAALDAIDRKDAERKEAEKAEQIRQAMLDETIPSSDTYYFDYWADNFHFDTVNQEGEQNGKAFLDIVESAVRSLISGRIQKGNDLTFRYTFKDLKGYKYRGGWRCVYDPGFGRDWVAVNFNVQLTKANKLILSFEDDHNHGDSHVAQNHTNNEIALQILYRAREAGLVRPDSMVLPKVIYRTANGFDLHDVDVQEARRKAEEEEARRKAEEEARRKRDGIQRQIETLQSEMDTLYFFQRGRKREIENQIAELYAELNKLQG